ncbi:UDP-N-acetylmuramoyl-L-alanine--D-glutamate ligase [Arthrobacter echini]|uniref:UDP-N-acetylmuramoylalanine--D-glutamate ligase n=1 Tax=Arthrobacter echini TaxID=1529066 RepID=A0A4S5E7E8_9MICC|nr:UDP-N-acetylmuramoyl-L-alanine--D-glutamate ligase [Arthrobacter echini]THJ67545.1 UDP-N-acetylmuramoyl-L-alanine--D-glutamate ligase [Arthrobacter echini]
MNESEQDAATGSTDRAHGTDRLDELVSWDADWAGLRVVVAGIGASGFSAADTLIELGAAVVVVDAQVDDENEAKADTLRIVGAREVLLGAEYATTLPLVDGEPAELVVTSPGWRPTQPLLAEAAAAHIPIWGDVELAWRVRIRQGRPTAEWLTITGTNGKTTTVGLTESMLLAAGTRAIAAGNVGTPILDVIRDPQGYDFIAVELSSFQLHWSHSISPLASVCLNVAEDHVDWHGSYGAYLAAKALVYERTRIACVYNVEQRETEAMVEQAEVIEGCRAIGFTTGMPSISMLGVVEDLLVDRAFIAQRKDSAVELAAVADLGTVVPRHLVADALAAAALVRAAGIDTTAVRAGIRAFRPGDHRIQVVGDEDGVLWIDDSKATNPHAAAASLASFESVVWIAGGLSKGVSYDELVREHAGRLRAVVLLGEDPGPLQGALARHAPGVPVSRHPGSDDQDHDGTAADAPTAELLMQWAVAEAARLAREGDTVLMAPAAASMDQFSSYAHRGAAFTAAVAARRARATTAEES